MDSPDPQYKIKDNFDETDLPRMVEDGTVVPLSPGTKPKKRMKGIVLGFFIVTSIIFTFILVMGGVLAEDSGQDGTMFFLLPLFLVPTLWFIFWIANFAVKKSVPFDETKLLIETSPYDNRKVILNEKERQAYKKQLIQALVAAIVFSLVVGGVSTDAFAHVMILDFILLGSVLRSILILRKGEVRVRMLPSTLRHARIREFESNEKLVDAATME